MTPFGAGREIETGVGSGKLLNAQLEENKQRKTNTGPMPKWTRPWNPSATRVPKLQGRAMSLGNSPVSLLPSLPLAVVPAASPRLPSQEARVSQGAGLPLGEASELCSLQLRQLSGQH